MDTLSLGHLIANIEHRLLVLETDWRKIKKFWRKCSYYAKRLALIVGIYLANIIAHMDPTQIGSWIKWAFGLMGNLLGLIA